MKEVVIVIEYLNGGFGLEFFPINEKQKIKQYLLQCEKNKDEYNFLKNLDIIENYCHEKKKKLVKDWKYDQVPLKDKLIDYVKISKEFL